MDAGEYNYAIAFQERIKISEEKMEFYEVKIQKHLASYFRRYGRTVTVFLLNKEVVAVPVSHSLLICFRSHAAKNEPCFMSRSRKSMYGSSNAKENATAFVTLNPTHHGSSRSILQEMAEMYVGDDVSPDFYGWVFPKYDHVGVGTGTVVNRPAIKDYQVRTKMDKTNQFSKYVVRSVMVERRHFLVFRWALLTP